MRKATSNNRGTITGFTFHLSCADDSDGFNYLLIVYLKSKWVKWKGREGQKGKWELKYWVDGTDGGGGVRKDTEQKGDSVLRLKVHNIREEKLIEGKVV